MLEAVSIFAQVQLLSSQCIKIPVPGASHDPTVVRDQEFKIKTLRHLNDLESQWCRQSWLPTTVAGTHTTLGKHGIWPLLPLPLSCLNRQNHPFPPIGGGLEVSAWLPIWGSPRALSPRATSPVEWFFSIFPRILLKCKRYQVSNVLVLFSSVGIYPV